MKSDKTFSEVQKTDFDSYHWGDLVTLRFLLGACVLMWLLGLIRLWFR